MRRKSEQELADELDAFLKATLHGRVATPPPDLPPETTALAESLIKLSQRVKPAPTFLTRLKRRLFRRQPLNV
jgi:hypothetical protein